VKRRMILEDSPLLVNEILIVPLQWRMVNNSNPYIIPDNHHRY